MNFDESYYNNGGSTGGYNHYSATTYSTQTAEQLATQFIEKSGINGVQLTGKKVLVVGCAYGYLVQYLVAQGVNAFGMDISTYAISQAPPVIADKLIVGDVRLSADWTRAKQLASITGNKTFDLVIDEDMIACLTNTEAATFRTLALANAAAFYHLLEVNPALSQWYNYKTISQWKTLLGTSPREKWYARFTWAEV